MITSIQPLPTGVIGFDFTGRIRGEDYETTVFPAIKAFAEHHEKIRIVCRFQESFDRFDFKALLDDTRVGLQHYWHWHRIAVVSDQAFMNQLFRAFSFLLPGQLGIFALADFDKAVAWVAGDGVRDAG